MSDLNYNKADIIAQQIRAKLNPSITLDPNLIDMINAIAELWEYKPSLARRLEDALIADLAR